MFTVGCEYPIVDSLFEMGAITSEECKQLTDILGYFQLVHNEFDARFLEETIEEIQRQYQWKESHFIDDATFRKNTGNIKLVWVLKRYVKENALASASANTRETQWKTIVETAKRQDTLIEYQKGQESLRKLRNSTNQYHSTQHKQPGRWKKFKSWICSILK